MALQIALLRRQYQVIQLLQLPVAFVFGYMTDFAVFAISPIHCNDYALQWGVCLVGIVLVAIGVSFEVIAGVVTLAGVLLVGTLVRKLNGRLEKITF
ncbi:hypothetical protein lbkm_2121 [Lachnospiraceae bacterium KM106-2]|nr:hypothetical protein lbkm_2121 [Lachnospiraceae bacterium KM106-2]